MESIALLTKLLVIAMAVLTVVHYSGIIGQLKIWIYKNFDIPYHRIGLKPLSCHICLSFWLAGIYFLAELAQTHQPLTLKDLYEVLLNSLATSSVSHFLYKIFK